MHYKFFFGRYMFLFDKELPKKLVSDKAWIKVIEYGCLFLHLQFPNFTYLQVEYFKGELYTLLQYPIDMIILMELVRHLMVVQAHQSTLHRLEVGIPPQNPLRIGGCSLDIVPKEKNMEFELQRITLKKFMASSCFDWRGLNEKT